MLEKITSEKSGILISYLIGLPIGFITVFMVFYLPVLLTGEGLPTIALVGIFGKATIGLLISFLFALGIAGYQASADLKKQKSLLKTSLNYSLTINGLIWSVFGLITILTNKEMVLLILAILVFAFVFCTIVTTFTLGLLICYAIKKRLGF